ncbi:MAG: hypothetical protein QXU98_02745 [Candidatus Parvarchaeota archaeon]
MKDMVSELQRMLYDVAKADPNKRFHLLDDRCVERSMETSKTNWRVI